MCGRYSLGTELGPVLARFGVEPPAFPWQPRWNIAPGQEVPVVKAADRRVLIAMGWGLAPPWAKPGFHPINLRSETLLAKPAFRELGLRQRCLLPADGFYEWDVDKQPWRFTLPDGELFGLAGVWTQREGRYTCAVLTKPSVDAVAAVHERMPLIVPQQLEEEWLVGTEVEQLLDILGGPAWVPFLERRRVSRRINSARAEGPECALPWEEAMPQDARPPR